MQKLSEALGVTIKMPGLDTGAPKENLGGPIEPWMREFVRERHGEEEWDFFFQYVKASTFQRVMMWVNGVIFRAFSFNKGRS